MPQTEAQARWYRENAETVKRRTNARYWANRDKIAAEQRQYAAAHKDHKRAYDIEYRARGDWHRRRHLRYKYGLTIEAYEARLASQGGLCAICRRPEMALGNNGETKRMAVDHDHDTGRVRGLLCSRCNPGLGYFLSSTELLESALAYLRGGDAK